MRIKTFLIVCGCVLITSYILIIFTSSEQQNDSIKNIVSQTNLHIKEIQVSGAMIMYIVDWNAIHFNVWFGFFSLSAGKSCVE